MAITDQLVAYYKFDASNSNDATANGNNGTDTSMTYGVGLIGNGAIFNGTTGTIALPSNVYSLFNGTNAYSFNGWMYLNGNSGQYHFFSATSNVSSFKYETRFFYQTNFTFTKGDATGVAIDAIDYSTTPTTSTWYMVTATYDGSTMTLYVNGTAHGTLSSTKNSGTNISCAIGKESLGIGYMDGKMDEVGFWSRALSGAEITTLYNGGAGLQPTFGSSFVPRRALMGVGF